MPRHSHTLRICILRYVRYIFKYVEMLLDNAVKPLLVFDGFSLPAKSVTRQKRREHRETNR